MKIKTERRNTILKIYFSLYISFHLFDEKRVIVKMRKKREKMEEKREKKRIREKLRNLSRKEVVLVTPIRMTLLCFFFFKFSFYVPLITFQLSIPLCARKKLNSKGKKQGKDVSMCNKIHEHT